MAYFGPVPVPAFLEPVLPYAKFAASLTALVATVVIAVVASPPAWAFMIVGAVSALGVFVVPNTQVQAVLQDGLTAKRAGEAAVSDVKDRNFPKAGSDITTAFRAVQDGVKGAEDIAKEL